MDLWNKVKNSLNKTLDEVETRSGEIKDSIHFQLELHKLKNHLSELSEEQLKVFTEIGQDYFLSVSQSLSAEKIVEKLSAKVSFIEDIQDRIKNLQEEINAAYQMQEQKKSSEDDEIDVTPKDKDK